MKKKHFYHFIFLFLMCQFAASFAFTQIKPSIAPTKPVVPITSTTVIKVTVDKGWPVFQPISVNGLPPAGTNNISGVFTITNNPPDANALGEPFKTTFNAKIVYYSKSAAGYLSVIHTFQLIGCKVTSKGLNPDGSTYYKVQFNNLQSQ